MTDRPSDRALAQAPNEDALIALFESVYEREWDRAAEESDDRRKAILGPADEHATRMAVRAVVAAAASDGAQAVAVYQRRCTRHTYCGWVEISRSEYEAAESHDGQYAYRVLHETPPSQDAEDAARLATLIRGCDDLLGMLKEACACWDTDQDSKVGKSLMAMAGYVGKYDKRATDFHEALIAARAVVAEDRTDG